MLQDVTALIWKLEWEQLTSTGFLLTLECLLEPMHNKKGNRTNGKGSSKKSCKATKEKEIALSKEAGSGIAGSYDVGWQHRGSGQTYNSLSGHSPLVGCRTGKIIDYELRIKSCKACKNAAKKCKKPNHTIVGKTGALGYI